VTDEPNHKFLRRLRKHCYQLAEMHRSASQTYARRATKLTVANLFASIAILFIAANDNAQEGIHRSVYMIIDRLQLERPKELDLGDLIIGIFSVIAVSTAALQFLLKYEERNLIHKYVATDYENLFRKIGRYLLKPTLVDDELHKINKQINALARHSPPISSHISAYADDIEKRWKKDGEDVG